MKKKKMEQVEREVFIYQTICTSRPPLSPTPKQHMAWSSAWRSRLGHLVFPGRVATGEPESFQVLDGQQTATVLCLHEGHSLPYSKSRPLSLQQTNEGRCVHYSSRRNESVRNARTYAHFINHTHTHTHRSCVTFHLRQAAAFNVSSGK